MSGSVVSDIQAQAEGERLYIRYNTIQHIHLNVHDTTHTSKCSYLTTILKIQTVLAE